MSVSLAIAATLSATLALPSEPIGRPLDGSCGTCLNDRELAGSISNQGAAGAISGLRTASTKAQAHDQLRLTASAAGVAQDKILAQAEQEAVSRAMTDINTGATLANPFGEALIVNDPGSTALVTTEYRTGAVSVSY